MTEVQDTSDRRAKWMRYLRWGLALAGMVCWTVFVGMGGFWCLVITLMSAGNTFDQKEARSLEDFAKVIVCGAPTLAVAPWIVGGIVLGVRWWRSRRRRPAEKSE